MKKLNLLYLLLMCMVLGLLPACGARQIADMPPVDQTASISGEFMTSYEDAYHEYNRIKASIPAKYAEEKS